MNVSRSPQRRRLVAASLATALACVGAAVATAAPSSAIPTGCRAVESFSITPLGGVWIPTTYLSAYTYGGDLGKGKYVRVPAGVKSTAMSRTTHAIAPADIFKVLRRASAYSHNRLEYGTSSNTRAATLLVKRGQTARVQQYKAGQKFLLKKYAATNRFTCQRGALLYRSTVVAPIAWNDAKYFTYKLVG